MRMIFFIIKKRNQKKFVHLVLFFFLNTKKCYADKSADY